MSSTLRDLLYDRHPPRLFLKEHFGDLTEESNVRMVGTALEGSYCISKFLIQRVGTDLQRLDEQYRSEHALTPRLDAMRADLILSLTCAFHSLVLESYFKVQLWIKDGSLRADVNLVRSRKGILTTQTCTLADLMIELTREIADYRSIMYSLTKNDHKFQRSISPLLDHHNFRAIVPDITPSNVADCVRKPLTWQKTLKINEGTWRDRLIPRKGLAEQFLALAMECRVQRAKGRPFDGPDPIFRVTEELSSYAIFQLGRASFVPRLSDIRDEGSRFGLPRMFEVIEHEVAENGVTKTRVATGSSKGTDWSHWKQILLMIPGTKKEKSKEKEILVETFTQISLMEWYKSQRENRLTDHERHKLKTMRDAFVEMYKHALLNLPSPPPSEEKMYAMQMMINWAGHAPRLLTDSMWEYRRIERHNAVAVESIGLARRGRCATCRCMFQMRLTHDDGPIPSLMAEAERDGGGMCCAESLAYPEAIRQYRWDWYVDGPPPF